MNPTPTNRTPDEQRQFEEFASHSEWQEDVDDWTRNYQGFTIKLVGCANRFGQIIVTRDGIWKDIRVQNLTLHDAKTQAWEFFKRERASMMDPPHPDAKVEIG